MSRTCPCGFDFDAPTPAGGGPRGRLGGELSFCSSECLDAFEWLAEHDPSGALRLTVQCGASRYRFTGPTGPTGTAYCSSGRWSRSP